MDKCVRIAVAVAISSHIVSGRSYIPNDRRGEYHQHQGYDYPSPHHHHHLPGHWHYDQSWGQSRPSGSYERPSRDQKWNKYPHDNKHWGHNSDEWESGSWEYPDYPSHGNQNSWGQHWGGHGHGRPTQWPKPNSGSSWPNRPTWDQERPTTSIRVPVNPQSSPRATTGSQDLLAVTVCIRSCPVTSEYNPVCGSNNVTYSNPGRLECAKYCGVDVTLRRNSACPPAGQLNDASQTTTTTARPVQPDRTTSTPLFIAPTRYTTVEIPATASTERPAQTNPPFTISPDLINSIFTQATTTEEDDQGEIDIRTRSRFRYA